MKVEKINSKAKVASPVVSGTRRKAVSQAMAKQDMEQKSSSNVSQEVQDAIRLKAYELYVERGYSSGDAAEDWLTAERIVLQNSR